MLSGYSSQFGVFFGDSDIEGDNAVYCWRSAPGASSGRSASCVSPASASDELCVMVGPYEEVRDRFRGDQDAGEIESDDNDRHGRLMLGLTAFALAFVVVIAVLFDGAPVFGAILFAIVGWFPAYALLATTGHDYKTDEMFEQFRRYHGAEHTVFYARKKKNEACLVEGGELSQEACVEKRYQFEREGHTWSLSELSEFPYLERECGTVYAAALLAWAVAAGVIIACSPYLGFLKTFGFLFAAAVLLLLNTWFNPLNPLKLAQWRMVSRPTPAELEVAAFCLQEFCRLERGDR